MNSIENYKPLGNIVYDSLKESILNGSLKPGERLMESKIADDLGVSRTPVREAIRKLEKEKYVKMVPRKGAYVEDLTKEDILEVIEIRVVLEGLAAELAARNITDEMKEKMKENVRKFNLASCKVDREELIVLDEVFHNMIYIASGNTKLNEIVKELQDQFQRFRLSYFNEFDSYNRLTDSHNKLFNAISNGDSSKAKEYAIAHIEEIKKNLIEWKTEHEQ
ncbi:GntR family transcriptional regulator [Clostridiaceae bacterium HSG29]|nr:GntR family transcriptional regulator [Clostridiaceae bacterium HSG29]